MRRFLLVSVLTMTVASVLQVQAQTPSAVGSGQLGSSGLSKSAACEAKGESKKEQLQLCLAQARIDCLKKAVDQKIFGKQRAEFVKTCMGEQPPK